MFRKLLALFLFLVIGCYSFLVQAKIFGRFCGYDPLQQNSFEFQNNKNIDSFKLVYNKKNIKNVTHYFVELHSLTPIDRPLTLFFKVKIAGVKIWHDSLLRNFKINSNRTYAALSGDNLGIGHRGYLSKYPIGAVSTLNQGYAIGIDMKKPACYTIEYNAEDKEFMIAYDLGFTQLNNKVELSFCVYNFKPELGFRGALQKYYKIYANDFSVRMKRHGSMMAFHSINSIPDWRDFGFTVKQGGGNVAWNNANNIMAFRSTNPFLWVMLFDDQKDNFYKAAVSMAKKKALKGEADAMALFACGSKNRFGKFNGLKKMTPRGRAVIWSLNPSPNIEGKHTAYNISYNRAVMFNCFEVTSNLRMSGQMIRSIETPDRFLLNFSKRHKEAAKTPLTYCFKTNEVGVCGNLTAWEHVKGVKDSLDTIDKMTIGDSTPLNCSYIVPLLDYVNNITNIRSLDIEKLLFYRMSGYQKPMSLLLNDRFKYLKRRQMEKFISYATAFAIFPSCFSYNGIDDHYFSKSQYFERDRSLFKKYIPICRKLSYAGWEPITRAKVFNAKKINIERFGNSFYTVLNYSRDDSKMNVSFDDKSLRLAVDLVSGKKYKIINGKLFLALASEKLAVLQVR